MINRLYIYIYNIFLVNIDILNFKIHTLIRNSIIVFIIELLNGKDILFSVHVKKCPPYCS